MRPVSILMLAVFTTQIVREALLHQHDFQGDECWAWSSWSLLLWALFPWVVYCSLVMDSQYWQGLYSDPEAANLNTPLLGVWGALPETPASTLASCICDLEAGEMVPIIPFSQLKLRTDVKFSSGRLVGECLLTTCTCTADSWYSSPGYGTFGHLMWTLLCC